MPFRFQRPQSASSVFTGSPGPRQHPFGSGHLPVSGRLSRTASEGAGHHVPVSRCLSAAGIRFLAILFPPGDRPSSRSAYRPCRAGPRRGFHVPHARDSDRGGRPLYPGDGGAHPAGRSISGRRLPLPCGQSLHPAAAFHLAGPNVTRHHQGFTRVHPSGLPLACGPRTERGPLGFFPELRTPPLPARTSERGQALDTGPGSHLRHQPTSSRWTHSTCATSCRTDPALPGRSSIARDWRVFAQPRPQWMEAVALLPGGSRSLLVRAGGDQGEVSSWPPPSWRGSSRRSSSHGNPAGVSSISFPRVRVGFGPGAGDAVQHGRRPGQVQGPADRWARSARPRAPGPGARAGRCRSCSWPPARSRPPATRARCPGPARATCPSSAVPCSAAR